MKAKKIKNILAMLVVMVCLGGCTSPAVAVSEKDALAYKQQLLLINDTVSLKEFFDTRLALMDKATEVRVASVDKSTTLALQALDKRLEGMNEFRAQLKEQTANFVTRAEYTAMVNKLDENNTEIRAQYARLEAGEKSASAFSAALDKRLESMNEFRGQLKDQAATFIGRAEHNAMLDRLSQEASDARAQMNKSITRDEFNIHVAKNIDDITVLRDFKATAEGKASQNSVIGVAIMSGLGLLLSVIGMFLNFKKS